MNKMSALNRAGMTTARPVVSRDQIAAWADQVEHGQAATAGLNDGSFVALMEELRKRGYEPVERSAAEKQLKPFVVRVAKS